MNTRVRALTSHASWILALIAIVVILAAQTTVVGSDDLAPFLLAGILSVVLASVGLAAGIVGMLGRLRPARPALLIPLVGIAANSLLLWHFAPPILCFYF